MSKNILLCTVLSIFVGACGGATTAQPSTTTETASATPDAVTPTTAPANPSARSYCIWADPALDRTMSTLTALGFSRAGFEEGTSRVITTNPVEGVSLRVEITNFVGRTRVGVTSINDNAEASIARFYAAFENGLQQNDCPPPTE